MAEILKELFHNKYSKSTISRITDITVHGIQKWISRPLEKKYIAIFMDAMFSSLRSDTTQKECVIFAIGIKETGQYEILGFHKNPIENHIAYRYVLVDLHERGLEEPLLFIADGLPGIDEEIKQIYPRSDFQLCTVHSSRNFESHVRVQDRDEIYSRPSEESAMKITYLRVTEINEKWSARSLRDSINAWMRSGKCSRRGILNFTQL